LRRGEVKGTEKTILLELFTASEQCWTLTVFSKKKALSTIGILRLSACTHGDFVFSFFLQLCYSGFRVATETGETQYIIKASTKYWAVAMFGDSKMERVQS